jgi:hypothetical protein
VRTVHHPERAWFPALVTARALGKDLTSSTTATPRQAADIDPTVETIFHSSTAALF